MPRAFPNLRQAPIAQGAAGTTTLVAAVANAVIVVWGYSLSMSATGTVKFQSASNDLTGAMDFATAGGGNEGTAKPLFWTNAGEALNLVSTLGAAKGHILYEIEY